MQWSKIARQRWQRRFLPAAVLSFITLAGVIILGWPSSAVANEARYYTELEFPPLAEVQIPAYERYQLENGLVVYLMEDHELPLISGTATFRTGERYQPENKTGLADVMGEAMRLGGTQSHDPDELNQLLEQRAASIETGVDTTAGTASFNALSEDTETVFELFSEVIRYPTFDPTKIDFLKNQYRGSIARRNDDPDDIAQREFSKLIYGSDSPYARTIEYDTLSNFDRQDILAFYQASVRPENTILGIVGDFDPAAMKALIAEYFGDWQPSSSSAYNFELPTVSQAKAGVFLVNRPQLTQSSVQMGHLGGKLNSEDYPAMSVLNEVLNGFSGRLFNQVRSQQGLAYSVYAFWAPRYDYPGTLIGGGQTRSEATVPFVKAVLDQLETVQTTPVAPAELKQAQDSVLNSFVFNFQSPEQTLSRLIRYEYYDYPSDFVFRFQKEVAAVTVENVLKAAQDNLKLDQVVVLVVGNATEIQPPLSSLTQDAVTQIDVTIPQPSA
ncbi:MAG: insulinase family protein [Leptolyngbyaceae cyanobacterium SM1_1_3]|nr:insulinase family protein [Leptolyngbyaceae cyanobacterium SM1_1_3]NJN01052.1 insulinase family protein [Leptolyngbyaceae cyanobacterium RM1_1_2]NJO11503.1 insulinase family protein [Leptolyngbyaceae cyanobacterium SL_1_1]